MLFVGVTWASVWLAVLLSCSGCRVWFLRTTLPRRCQTWLARLGIRRFGTVDISQLDFLERGPEAPARRNVELTDSWRVSALDDALLSYFPGGPNGPGCLRVALLRKLANTASDAFAVDVWTRSVTGAPTLVITRSWWESKAIRHSIPESVMVTAFPRGPSGLISRVWRQTAPRLRVAITRIPVSRRSHMTPVAPDDTASSVQDRNPTSPIVAMVLNFGLGYGSLYEYDALYSDDVSSPFHPMNMAFLSRVPMTDPVGRPCYSYPGGRKPVKTFAIAMKMMRVASHRAHRATPLRIRWHQCTLIARACVAAADIGRDLPGLQIALVAYDLQLPMDLALALGNQGVTTVALNERPAMAHRSISPFAVDVLLTASHSFSAAIRDSPVISTTQRVSVGLWRTDLVFDARESQSPEFARNAGFPWSKLALVLPFELKEQEDPSTYPLATGIGAFTSFVESILLLAKDHPSVLFVIRGKSAAWMDDPHCRTQRILINQASNVVVDLDYDTLNRTYHIAAFADVIIAKPTSLVDEMLSLGTPCVIHDFSQNTTNYARSTYRYLPHMLWAGSNSELNARVDYCLLDDGDAFRRAWEPQRVELYGSFSDGHVRARARIFVESLIVHQYPPTYGSR